MIDRLPEDALTLHAECLTLLLASERDRGWSHLSGSFSTKTVKGGEYVYFQYSDPGGAKRQFSIGPRDARLDAIVAQYGVERRHHEEDRRQLERLAKLLRTAGVATVPHAPARVIRALTDAGVFRLGGVLVGSYAFVVLGNLLGVRWPSAAWRTQDVDIAGHLQVAVPELEADVPRALESLRMGFIPVPQLDSRQPSSSFRVRGKPVRVDLLTPGSEGDRKPIYIPRFKAAAAPIQHLSLVMRDAQPAAAVDGGVTLVVVPAPARFALHKLFISQRRSVIQQTKGGKDQHQAALLFDILAEDRPEDLERAAESFAESGPVVTSRLRRAMGQMVKRWPEAEAGRAIVVAAMGD